MSNIKVFIQPLPDPLRVSLLKDQECCGRCALRFLCCRDYNDYKTDTEYNLRCPGCSGMLSNIVGLVDDYLFPATIAYVDQQKLDLTSFDLCLKLPSNLILIRQRSIFYEWMQENEKHDFFTNKAFKEVTDLKDILRQLLAERLAERLQCRFDRQSDFVITFELKTTAVDENVCLSFNRLAHILFERQVYYDEVILPEAMRKGDNTVPSYATYANLLRLVTNVDENYGRGICKILYRLIESEKHIDPYAPKAYATTFEHASLYIGGRYIKLNRHLSQTRWSAKEHNVNSSCDKKTTFSEKQFKNGAASIEEFIGNPLKSYFNATNFRFMSAGREDVDVRMLNDGRPFAIEILQPIRRKDALCQTAIKMLEKTINENSLGWVFVRDLRVVQASDLQIIKDGEENKTKTYSCYIYLPRVVTVDDIHTLNNHKNMLIQQKTPLRVVHRRSVAVRAREIYWMKAEAVDSFDLECMEACKSALLENKKDADMSVGESLLQSTLNHQRMNTDYWSKDVESKVLHRLGETQANAHHIFDQWCRLRRHMLKLTLNTQAGAYIKEFVHSDLGRTVPSIGSLLGDVRGVDLVSLDVEHVHLCWPPSTECDKKTV